MAGLRIKKGDVVKVIAGSLKGQTGKVVAVLPNKAAVKVEGLNLVKRHTKPSMVAPQGGITELHKSIDISKVALVVAGKKDATSRISYSTDKTGQKVRIYKATNKEIDV